MPLALITGASSGIGEQFARQLAARDYETILVARREDRLLRLIDELPAPSRAIACDLTTDAATLKPKVDELGLEVDLLVNNAGFGTYGRFWDIDPGRDAEMTRLNC